MCWIVVTAQLAVWINRKNQSNLSFFKYYLCAEFGTRYVRLCVVHIPLGIQAFTMCICKLTMTSKWCETWSITCNCKYLNRTPPSHIPKCSYTQNPWYSRTQRVMHTQLLEQINSFRRQDATHRILDILRFCLHLHNIWFCSHRTQRVIAVDMCAVQ